MMRLLVVLAIEEARDVDRVALEPRSLFLDLRLGSATGDVRHALEQSAARVRGRLRSLFLVGRRSDRGRADRAGQHVVGAKQELLAFVRRKLGVDFGRLLFGDRLRSSGRRRRSEERRVGYGRRMWRM